MVYTQTKQPITSQKKMVQYSNRAKTFHQSEKDGTILKQGQNLSPVRKRWYNTQTGTKSVTSQKKMVQYSNSAKSCHQSEMDGTIVKQSNLPKPAKTGPKPIKRQKRWYYTQTKPKPDNSRKKTVQYSNRARPVKVRKRWYNTQTGPKPDNTQKKIVQFSNRAKTC